MKQRILKKKYHERSMESKTIPYITYFPTNLFMTELSVIFSLFTAYNKLLKNTRTFRVI